MSAPLEGVLVADFSRVLAGPLCTMTLGDLGADVIKVERPDTGDDTRSWGPPFVDGESSYYLAVNRNKRSIALDLGTKRGRTFALALASRADVVVENFRAGAMERFGLGYDVLHERNPALVYCGISAFGPGRDGNLPGYDFLVQALGGLMSITGPQDGEPTKVGVALVDVLTGMNAVIGIMAALMERRRTGRGQRVDVNLMSSVLAALVNQASSYLTAGIVPGRMGNQHPSIAPYETFTTATDPIAVAVGNDSQFHELCEALGKPQLAHDRRFSTNPARVQHRAALLAELEEVLAGAPCEEWVARLQDRGVPCGPVNDIAKAFAFAEGLGLEAVRDILRPDGSVVRQVASPLSLSGSEVRYDRPPPHLGEHTTEILSWLDGGDMESRHETALTRKWGS